MRLDLDKPWRDLSEEVVALVPAQLGVYQLADADEKVIYSGYAGGQTLFGLRGEIDHQRTERPGARFFRFEVNMQYWSRHKELLMRHASRHGGLPDLNEPESIGSLHE